MCSTRDEVGTEFDNGTNDGTDNALGTCIIIHACTNNI